MRLESHYKMREMQRNESRELAESMMKTESMDFDAEDIHVNVDVQVRPSVEDKLRNASSSLDYRLNETETDRTSLNIWMEMLKNTFNFSMAMMTYVSVTGAQKIKAETGCLRGYDNRIRSIFIFCEKTAKNTPVFIEDTLRDSRCWHHHTVQKEPNTRSYVCLPLFETRNGTIACVCLADREPQQLSQLDKDRCIIMGKLITDIIHSPSSPDRQLENWLDDTVPVADSNNNAFQLMSPIQQETGLILLKMLNFDEKRKWMVWSANNAWLINTKVYCGADLLDQMKISKWESVSKSRTGDRVEQVELLTKEGRQLKLFCHHISLGSTFRDEWSPHLNDDCEKLYACKVDFTSGTDSRRQFCPFADILISEMLGRGSYGEVYLATWNGKKIALKLLTAESAGDSYVLPKEVVIGGSLKHPNLIETYDYRMSGSELWILLELCEKGSLYRMIDSGYFTSHKKDDDVDKYKEILKIIRQIADGLNYLHSMDIIHGDLSANNILMKRNCVVKISDFGMIRAMAKSSMATKTHGTVAYMPPELLESGQISKGTDVYSFGVIMFELVTGKRVYPGMREGQIITSKLYPKGDDWRMPDSEASLLQHIVDKCVGPLKDRYTFEEIVKYLIDLDENNLKPVVK